MPKQKEILVSPENKNGRPTLNTGWLIDTWLNSDVGDPNWYYFFNTILSRATLEHATNARDVYKRQVYKREAIIHICSYPCVEYTLPYRG